MSGSSLQPTENWDSKRAQSDIKERCRGFRGSLGNPEVPHSPTFNWRGAGAPAPHPAPEEWPEGQTGGEAGEEEEEEVVIEEPGDDCESAPRSLSVWRGAGSSGQQGRDSPAPASLPAQQWHC